MFPLSGTACPERSEGESGSGGEVLDSAAEPSVPWMMDATYRNDLREINELNFAKFDAKQEQRLAELKSELVKWMFAFWAPTAFAVAALLFRR